MLGICNPPSFFQLTITLRFIVSPFLSQINAKNIFSYSFNVCSDGVGSTEKTCITIGNANVFITHTLPNSQSVLKDQSFNNLLTDSSFFVVNTSYVFTVYIKLNSKKFKCSFIAPYNRFLCS